MCAVQNGELNPCCKREKLKEVLLGHQPYRMAKALWDYSMVEKHEASEHARLVVVQRITFFPPAPVPGHH